ncbi:nitrous oxide reductase accessory protein NosL [Thioclava atlantica]|uniref:NosL protein required for nitrous oxide reduction n=1 Tax=Thioclava atlantica TaxID=1317124 RepID=A0A085U0R4_9RHOB|nr:nitrous oxide reductase accessory protein NosL [Thioclava atlantica]KFE36561.1 NosL protein required for nitrous oxide reduction [Thioclava atlantica]
MIRLLLIALLACGLAACKEDQTAAKPAPAALTDEALGHYCQMIVADHPGPKAQIHLRGYDYPIWFGQVSDAIAYLHDPERDGEVTAFYVTDMARAESWAVPGDKAWTDADGAVFVIDSQRKGGMGMPEAVPFASRDGAEAFVAEAGGRIVALKDVPESYVHPDMGSETDSDMEGMSAKEGMH